MSERTDLTDYAYSESEEGSEWIEKRLGEVFDSIYSGGTPKKGVDEYYDGGIPFVKIEDLNEQQGGGVTTAENYITEQALNETSTRAFDSGTLLMTIYGSLAETALVQSRVATNQGILGLWDADEDNVLYVRYAIDHSQPKLASLSRQTTQANLGKGIVRKHKIPIPPLPEQRKIATVLHTVDRAIRKLSEVIEQASYLKKGVMQDLFTEGYYEHNNQKEGTLRWKNIPESWSLPQLSEVASINPNYNDVDRLVDYIQMDAVDTDLPEPSYIGQRNPQENSGRLFKQGDTLFARITPCTENGKICFVGSIDSEIGIGSTEYAVLSPENKLLPKYLYYYTRTHQVRDYAISRMRGSTGRQRVPFDVFRKEISIPLPPEREQREIIDCLDSIDSIIRINNSEKERLRRIQQGLMQDLLSGTVRTTDTNIQVPDEVAQYG